MHIHNFFQKAFQVLCVSLFFSLSTLAQGQFAGTMKPIVGSTYKDSNLIPALDGFEFQEGSLISAASDPESITVDVYKKGNTSVVFFSITADTANNQYQVMDAIEIKQIQPGWEVRTAFCRQAGVGKVEIVALVQDAKQEYLRNVKQAWRFVRGQKKFQVVNPKLVDCLQEGQSPISPKKQAT